MTQTPKSEASKERRKEYERQRHLRRYVQRGPVKYNKLSSVSIQSPTVAELYWAAGFMEGEGSFVWNRSSQVATAVQKEKEPVERLQRWFGGRLTHQVTDKRYTWNNYWRWVASGPRARGVMFTLYGILSERRKAQIRAALKGERFDSNDRKLSSPHQ